MGVLRYGLFSCDNSVISCMIPYVLGLLSTTLHAVKSRYVFSLPIHSRLGSEGGIYQVVNGGNGSPAPLVAIPGVYTGYEPGILASKHPIFSLSAISILLPKLFSFPPSTRKDIYAGSPSAGYIPRESPRSFRFLRWGADAMLRFRSRTSCLDLLITANFDYCSA